MAISFKPSQQGSSHDPVPLAWTANPIRLLFSDMVLGFRKLPYIFGILSLQPSRHPLDELYPWSVKNMVTLAIHLFLIVYQLAFLASIPVWIILHGPALWFIVYCASVLGVNTLICGLLNGPAYLDSKIDIPYPKSHNKERWIFLNGVAVGSHWLQANIDRLALTFRRPVRGVHNPTAGIVFDLAQCLLERNFSYSTDDVRVAYKQIKDALVDSNYDKIVLILHSQGGIQGSLIVPQTLLSQLEIYTFGNAANHFNNPHWDLRTYLSNINAETQRDHTVKSIGHIEHYAHNGDFVAQWGILNFTNVPNRFMGRVFERPGDGHLLNQHYLNAMFPLGDDGTVKEKNEFMETAVQVAEPKDCDSKAASHETVPALPVGSGIVRATNGITGSSHSNRREGMLESLITHMSPTAEGGSSLIQDVNSPVQKIASRQSSTLRVKDFSRLWQYRNGKSPPPEAQELREEAAKRQATW
ncbi:hypothetical protein KC332_g9188 [Hortaea werneckii]|uniref:DUF676 domain-containing protein n=1 Tax=Hortaea werneckii EXF-2000 TaxID=1157616 RepID=A0A1Z5TP30_HORWE|nr:hypothetical protein KC358_g8263 [Hortaea werneckii]OTA37780.1 hypothetical protein BTJ68_01885 [Hortaea werneckii EXF-2000]KAI6849012.1 hypothetical protein KC350_g2777 [Hortaea werneckii]KAI6924168.1 hypothetical protein KC348_g9337 [Hortaea werneckii]KAI6934670.1 hypothetical protein KC341_g7482 [Hortaea werneckii]